MNNRPHMKTTKKQIVEWCQRNINECGYPVDASEMGTHCFHCGYERATERAHTVPWSKYDYDLKYDSPEYYRLLCSDCHSEALNVMDENAMDKWIVEDSKKFNPHGYYNFYWEVRNKIEEIVDKTGQHGFEPMNQATLEWCEEQFKTWMQKRIKKTLDICKKDQYNG